MINACLQCGEYHADKIIDPSGPYAICPACGYRHPFRQLPLLVISGASGTGKTTVCQRLVGKVDRVVLLDSDILWSPTFDHPEDHYRNFFETWLRLAMNLGQSGRPVVLFGAGMGVPSNLEPYIERRYFTRIHYLALTCTDEALNSRLRARPGWRGLGDPAFIEAQMRFNRWFCDEGPHTDLPVECLDTSTASIEETCEQVTAWIRDISLPAK